MSVNVRIRTNNRRLNFEQVVSQLTAKGYRLVIKFINPETCEFYQYRLSTRPIDLSLEDNGYEVRITSLACREDYELFVKTVTIIQEQTDGNVYCEDDDDECLDNVPAFLDSKWIELQMKSDAMCINTLVLGEHINAPSTEQMCEVEHTGPHGNSYIGENVLEKLNITINKDSHEIYHKLIRKFHYS